MRIHALGLQQERGALVDIEQYLSRYRLLRLRYERELGTTYGDRHYLLLLPSKSRQPDKLSPVAYREYTEASNVVDTSTST